MPILDLTDEQVIALLEQLPDEQKQRVMTRLSQAARPEKQPRFGSAKHEILFMADDFDAPLD